MFYQLIRVVLPVICCLPFYALAAESRSIHIEWGYTPPSEPAVIGFKLYQEGAVACQVKDSTATAMDCEVTLYSNPTNFTLTAMFADGTESPHSAPFAFAGSDEVLLPASGGTVSKITAPTARISTSVAAGTCPLTVTFDASGSSSTAGLAVVGFLWDFGDGGTGKTAIASHVYREPGTYNAKLTVTDVRGLQNSVTTPIVVAEAVGAPATTQGRDKSGGTGLAAANNGVAIAAVGAAVSASPVHVTPVHLEVGDIQVVSDWVRVSFAEPYNQPIVVAGPPQSADPDPCTVRIRNVTRQGFDIRLTEWPYQDGVHTQEKVSYLVLEKGRSMLEDGTVVVAGAFTGSTSWQKVSFPVSFSQTPVVLTTPTSVKDSKAVTGRVLPVRSGFSYLLMAQEKAGTSVHKSETVHYVAWAAGKASQDAIRYEAVVGDSLISNAWKSIRVQSRFLQPPSLFAEMRTRAGLNTAALRLQKLSKSGFQVKVQEEQSLDNEVAHLGEKISYLALAPTGPVRLASFSWDFDRELENTISGFQILANGEELCATDDPEARALSCTIIAPSQETKFSIDAIMGGDALSGKSNTITYSP
ncbi:MAG: PKD domain-containing protein [Desulfobulbus sp.]|nr:PKD domain-containing protein [Desulfobulbus sp.]